LTPSPRQGPRKLRRFAGGARLGGVAGSRTIAPGEGGRTRGRRSVCLLVLGIASCGGGSQPDPPDTSNGGCPSDLPSRDACGPDIPSYRLEVEPIVEQRCGGCHFPGNTQSGNVLTNHADVFRQRQTVLSRIYSCVMPPDEAPALTSSERQALLAWFVCGAPDN
jgi:hypothetical protein